MKPFALILSIALFIGSAQRSQAAVLLSSLTHPTMQTLIALGNDGVIVGSDRFYDFAITGTSPAAPVSANVAVEPITTADGDGLRFLAGWFATSGGSLTSGISYQIAASPSAQVAGVSLYSNGTIPSPDTGTFVAASLSTQSLSNTPVAPTITAFADGVSPSTASVSLEFTPQTDLIVTDSITLASAAGNPGGAANASVIENTFIAVPEPSRAGYFFPVVGALAATFFRRSPGRQSCRHRASAL
jgi:hypothetical protein